MSKVPQPATTGQGLTARSLPAFRFRWGMPALVLLLTLVAAALRLYRLDGRSLWLDEIVTAYAGRFDHLSDLLRYLHFWVDNAPLPYFVTWLLRGLGGSEIPIRLPSVVAGTLCIPAIYLLGKTLVAPRVGLLAASLMAVLPFAVWYSQEARSYAFLMLFTILQALFAYLSVTRSRWYDWLGLSIFTVLNMYTQNLGLIAAASTAIFVAVALLAETLTILVKRRAEGEAKGLARHALLQKLALAVGAALLIVLAYLPWLPSLQAFLARRDLGFGLVAGNARPTLDTLGYLLDALDMHTLLLIPVLIGLAVCAVWLVRGPWLVGALLLIWTLFLPVVFWLNVHGAMLNFASRYYSTIYPAFVLLAAVGVDAVASLLGRLIAGLRIGALSPARPARSLLYSVAIFSVLALLLLGQTLPALAQSYNMPKEDYRGAAAFITSSSQPGSVALLMGMNDVVYFPESVQYYLDLQHSTVKAVDARFMDEIDAQRLAKEQGSVWAVVYHGPDDTGQKQAQAQGLEVKPFLGMSLVRDPTPGKTAVEQAQTLLHWGATSDPKLLSTSSLLDFVSGKVNPGPSLLPPTSSSTSTVLTASGGDTTSTIVVQRVQGGHTYLVTYRCRADTLKGEQRVFISSRVNLSGPDIFLNGLGIVCPSGADWTADGFAYTTPAAATTAIIWLRATGTGSAEFDDVELRDLGASKQ